MGVPNGRAREARLREIGLGSYQRHLGELALGDVAELERLESTQRLDLAAGDGEQLLEYLLGNGRTTIAELAELKGWPRDRTLHAVEYLAAIGAVATAGGAGGRSERTASIS